MALSNYLPSSRVAQPGVCTSTTRPASPYEGMVIYETDTNKTYVWNGSAWVMMVAADSPPGLELVGGIGCSAGGTAANGVVTVGSSQTSVTITNAFSSTYDSYLIRWDGGASSSSGLVNLQLSGSTTASHYYSALTDVNISTGAVGGQGRNGTVAYFDYVGYSTTTSGYVNCELQNPFLSKPTQCYGRIINPSGAIFPGTSWGYHTQSTSYSGFVLSGVTMTGGTIRVYGYRNSI